MRLQTPEHIRHTHPAPARLAPVPTPGRVWHRRAVEHDIAQAWTRAVDADDVRDARALRVAGPGAIWPALRRRNPAQLRIEF